MSRTPARTSSSGSNRSEPEQKQEQYQSLFSDETGEIKGEYMTPSRLINNNNNNTEDQINLIEDRQQVPTEMEIDMEGYGVDQDERDQDEGDQYEGDEYGGDQDEGEDSQGNQMDQDGDMIMNQQNQEIVANEFMQDQLNNFAQLQAAFQNEELAQIGQLGQLDQQEQEQEDEQEGDEQDEEQQMEQQEEYVSDTEDEQEEDDGIDVVLDDNLAGFEFPNEEEQQIMNAFLQPPPLTEEQKELNEYKAQNISQILRNGGRVPQNITYNPRLAPLVIIDALNENRTDIALGVLNIQKRQPGQFNSDYQNNRILLTAIKNRNYQVIEVLLFDPVLRVNPYNPMSVVAIFREIISVGEPEILQKILTHPNADFGFINPIPVNTNSVFENVTDENKQEIFYLLFSDLERNYNQDIMFMLFRHLDPSGPMITRVLLNVRLNKQFFDEFLTQINFTMYLRFLFENNVGFQTLILNMIITNQIDKAIYFAQKILKSETLQADIKERAKMDILNTIVNYYANNAGQLQKQRATQFLRGIIRFYNIRDLRNIKDRNPNIPPREIGLLYSNSINDVWIKTETANVLMEQSQQFETPSTFYSIFLDTLRNIKELAPAYNLRNYLTMMKAISNLPDSLILNILSSADSRTITSTNSGATASSAGAGAGQVEDK
jgi:hypothetical protein